MGTHKALRYDAASHRAVLAPAWVSRASATQRAGRTGRVRPGRCWRLYGRERFEVGLRDHELSEIHRQPLDAVVLNLRAMIDAPTGLLLASTLEPPEAAHVNRSLGSLRDSGFLTQPRGDAKALQAARAYDWEESNGDPYAARRAAEALEGALTPQGRFVASLGVDLRLGRLVAVGASMGCGPAATAVAAVLSLPRSPLRGANPLVHQDPDEYNALVRDGFLARWRFDGGDYSEPVALARLDAAYNEAPDKGTFCRAHCLAHGRARQCAQAASHLRRRVADTLGAHAGRPAALEELADPVMLNAVRCVLARDRRRLSTPGQFRGDESAATLRPRRRSSVVTRVGATLWAARRSGR